MAHEVETMFSARELPWHRLGTVTADVLNAGDALKAAGLDWTVDLTTILAELPNGKPIPVDDSYAVVRNTDSAVLGVVGSAYTPVQNEELFSFVDAIVDSGDAKYETAGSLRGGRIVWVCARLDRELKIAGDEHVPYLVASTSHDGTMGLRALATPVRVVCANTLRLSVGRARSQYKIRHTANAQRNVQEAREALGLTFAYVDEFEAEVNRLIEQEVTAKRFDAAMEKAFPKGEGKTDKADENAAEKRLAVRRIYEEDPAVSPFQGTGWGLVNAINSWELWDRPVRGGDGDEADVRAERQGMRILWGSETPATARVHQMLVRAR